MAAQVVKRKYCTRKVLLGPVPYKLGKDVCFLTPVGKVGVK